MVRGGARGSIPMPFTRVWTVIQKGTSIVRVATYDQPGDPEVLTIAEAPDPVPAPDEVLIRVKAISVEGGDLLNRRQRPRQGLHDILGYAAAGEVLAVGADVTGISVGQNVATFRSTGSHAELRAAPAATCWPVPEGVDLGVAAAIPAGAGTAALAVALAEVGPGDTVLVLGAAGGVGLATVQIAARAGARVLGTGSNPETLQALRAHGLAEAIVIGGGRSITDQVREALGGEGADVLIDNVGGAAMNEGIASLRDGGRAVLVGAFGGFDTPLDTEHIVRHRKTVIGCLLGPIMGEPEPYALIEGLLQDVARDRLWVPIDSTFPLEQAGAAHRRAQERGRLGRVIITP